MITLWSSASPGSRSTISSDPSRAAGLRSRRPPGRAASPSLHPLAQPRLEQRRAGHVALAGGDLTTFEQAHPRARRAGGVDQPFRADPPAVLSVTEHPAGGCRVSRPPPHLAVSAFLSIASRPAPSARSRAEARPVVMAERNLPLAASQPRARRTASRTPSASSSPSRFSS